MTNFSNKPDGISIYTENLLINLNNLKNLEIYLFVTRNNYSIIKERLKKNINFKKIKINKLLFSNKIYIFFVLTLLLNLKKFRIVVSPSLVPVLILLNKSVKVIHDFTFIKKGNSLSNMQKLYRHFLHYTLFFDDIIGYISNATLRDINQYGKKFLLDKKKVYLPNGLSNYFNQQTKIKSNKIQNNEVNFLFIGSLNLHKGLDKTIKFLNFFTNKYSHLKISVNFAGKEKAETKKILNKYKIYPTINANFLDYVTDNYLCELYKKSDFLIFFSRNEGCGLPVLESIKFNCIPLLSKIEAFEEFFKNNNYPFFLDNDNYSKLSKDIFEVFSLSSKKNKIQMILDEVLVKNLHNYKKSALAIDELI